MACLKAFLVIIILCQALFTKAQERYPVSGNFRNMSFSDFVEKVESTLPVKFFYKEEWISDIRIPDHSNCIDLECILELTFRGNNLYYLIEESGNIIITRDYGIRVNQTPAKEGHYMMPGQNQVTASETGSDIKIVEIGNPAERNAGGQAILTGYISDGDTKESLVGATVFSKKLATGSISNEYGFYSIKLPRGLHQLTFKLSGFKEKTISVNLNGSGEVNIELESEAIPLKAVVITSDRNLTLQRFEVGAERINMKTFRLQPTTLGETDILKSILLIPGVKSVGEGSSGYNVRGGTADQNLILLYGAPFYNSSHFFGFFSAVNSDIIREVTLYKGGIPAKYGGRISSVLDITTRDGNRKEFSGNAGISPVTTHITVEGPLIRDTLSYMLSARSTYSNWIFGLLTDPQLKKSRASFYDLNGKVTYDLNKKNRFELAGSYGHDDFRFNFDSLYRYNTSIMAVKWRHFFTSRFLSFFSVNRSSYEYNITASENPYEAFKLLHKLSSTGGRAEFNWFSEKHEINFGLEITRYNLNPGEFLPDSDSSLIIPERLQKEQAWESGLYFDDKITINKFLSIAAGIRLSGFLPNAPTIYGGPELRMSVNFRISNDRSFKINYNKTRQYLHLLSNSAAISPTDIWQLSNIHFGPQIGDQFAAGYYRIMRKSHMEFSAEVYYKKIRNMIDFKGGANIVMNENIENDIVPVIGKGYGIEMNLKRTEGKLNYSLGYTYSRIFQRTTTSFPSEQINSGEWFPANFDKPHDLTITSSYIYSRRFSFSFNYLLSSGKPITFPIASYIIYDNKIVHYSDRNRYRVPDYSRLDMSVTINGNLKSKKLTHPRWTFSVYNVLARKNVYSIYFKRENDVIKGYKLSIFGRAIPSVTYSFEF